MLTLGVEPRIPAYKTNVITVSLCEHFMYRGDRFRSCDLVVMSHALFL